jgi:hypothetical protein
MIFAKSIEYPKFSNKNPLKQNKKYFGIKRKKPRCFNKKPRLILFVSVRNRICLIKKNKKKSLLI